MSKPSATAASPCVTVIIPTYNWSRVLPYSIGSVLRQTFADFELLVVGDGCTDDSEQVVTAIPDPRLRWINLPVNDGHQFAPNNEGLLQARGPSLECDGIVACRADKNRVEKNVWLSRNRAPISGRILSWRLYACRSVVVRMTTNGGGSERSGIVSRAS